MSINIRRGLSEVEDAMSFVYSVETCYNPE